MWEYRDDPTNNKNLGIRKWGDPSTDALGEWRQDIVDLIRADTASN